MWRMSYSATETQFVDGSKDVTRRLGWHFLKRGDRFLAVRKAQGLKKGEKQVVLGAAVVRRVSRVPLSPITKREVVREGFPHLSPQEFVEMFCKMNRCTHDTIVTRIVFQRIEEP